MTEHSDRYLALMGRRPRNIPNWEHWSCPDAVTHITGIDYYEHPRTSTQRLMEMYPQLELALPESDEARPRPELDLTGTSSAEHPEGGRAVRWGDGISGTWEHGERFFRTAEDVFAFSPLQQGDFTAWPVVESLDLRDEEKLYRHYRDRYPAEWGDRAPDGSTASVWYYNTMFMWPLLSFGWELFLETCLDERFERIMDEFAELNRRVFRVFARLPVRFVLSHDDIVTTRGPVCSPEWMHKYVFPRYEEFWGMLSDAGKRVIMVCDGCMDRYIDDVFACGASGVVTEPYTDLRAVARKHTDAVIAGEGDNRVLMRNDPHEIRSMVDEMLETSQMTGGYFMCIGNHIPWNTPPEAVKLYLDLCRERAHR